jgi:hypothetical protein
MSKAVDFIGDVFDSVGDAIGDVVDFVGDTGGDIIEAAGDAVSSIGNAVEDVGEWVNDSIIQPFLEDPIGWSVQAAGAYFGGPLGAFAASTAVNLSHGEDLDDSLRAGATAGLATWAGNATSNYLKTGNFSAPINPGDYFDDAMRAGASTTGSNVVGALDESQVMANQPIGFDDVAALTDSQVAPPPIDPGDFAYTSSADELANEALKSDDLLRQMGEKTPGQLNAEIPQPKLTSYQAPKPIFDVSQSIDDAGVYKKYEVGEPTAVDLTGVNKTYVKPQPGDAAYVPDIVERSVGTPGAAPEIIRVDMAGKPLPDVPNTGWQSAGNLADAVVDEAGSYIWDGAKWIWKNPELALLGGTLLMGGLGGKDDPGGDKGGKPEEQQKRDDAFNASLPQYDLNRDYTASPFDRNANPYESDLYKYAIKGGEHNFYTPTTYTPTTYDSTVKAATGGPIGALNSQEPSYYRYGAMPMNMAQGGYASGGLNSIKQDGRSDHIPAMLSDGEYVVDAETVALLGNGSNKAGANRLESMRQNIRKQKGGALARGQFSPNARSPLAYIKQRG